MQLADSRPAVSVATNARRRAQRRRPASRRPAPTRSWRTARDRTGARDAGQGCSKRIRRKPPPDALGAGSQRSRACRQRSWHSASTPFAYLHQLRIDAVAQAVAEEVESEDERARSPGPGKIVRCGASNRCDRPASSMVPQLGVGGCTPRPRKLSAASAMIAPAMPSVAWTTTAGSAVGSTCRRTIRAGAGAERARGLHELELPRAQRLPAHEPRVAHPADHRQREHDVGQARAEDGDERDRQQDPGKRHQHIDDPADHIVHTPAEVAGNRAEQHADGRRHRHDREADQQRDARARQQAREDVAAELVEAERMREARPLEPARQLLRRRIVRASAAARTARRQTAIEHDDEADADHQS